jgi:hypothetical protein
MGLDDWRSSSREIEENRKVYREMTDAALQQDEARFRDNAVQFAQIAEKKKKKEGGDDWF